MRDSGQGENHVREPGIHDKRGSGERRILEGIPQAREHLYKDRIHRWGERHPEADRGCVEHDGEEPGKRGHVCLHVAEPETDEDPHVRWRLLLPDECMRVSSPFSRLHSATADSVRMESET